MLKRGGRLNAFIGREEELNTLEREYARASGFVVIYGRRRVGKTTLIKEFIKIKEALYFLATEEIENLGKKRLLSAVAAFTGQEYLKNASFNDWEAIFKLWADHNPGQKKILVIDEFQYLVQVNRSFPSLFQRIWDETLKNSNAMVILCGSLISLMTTQVLNYSSPLYGRRTAQIRLKPLKFTEIEDHYPQKPFKALVDLYALTGGVPKYLEFFTDDKPLAENIRLNIFSKSGYLYEEPLFLLEKEVREPVTYFSIIKTIATGKHKLQEIASALELKANTLSPYLKTLADIDLVEKRVPVTEKTPQKSRKGLYYISDSFIRFWFTFVYPCKGDLEIDNLRPALEKFELHYVDNFLSFVFEEISRDIFLRLCHNGAINYNSAKVGAYWEGKSGNEIDLVAIDEEKKQILFGECKYYKSQPLDVKVYSALLQKSKAPLFGGYEHFFALFSVSGFDQRLVEIAAKTPNLFLINEGQLYLP
jgi:uncharacterized protein